MRLAFAVVIIWVCVLPGMGCYHSASSVKCQGNDTETCVCDTGEDAGIQSCDETGNWGVCTCLVDTAIGHPKVALEVDFSNPNDWVGDGTVFGTDTAAVVDTTDDTTDTVMGKDTDTTAVADSDVPDVSDTTTDEPSTSLQLADTAENANTLYQEYRDRVPGNFWMTIPDERFGNNGLFHTIIDLDSDNDTWTWIDGYQFSQLPLRKDGLFEMIYSDNGTVTQIGGRDALMIHARGMAGDEWSDGDNVEFSLELDAPVNMSGENYHVSFDVLFPEFILANDPALQFAVFGESERDCLYSMEFYRPISPTKSASFKFPSGEWTTISGDIKSSGGGIDFSSFNRDPDDWVVESFRIKLSSNNPIDGQDAQESSKNHHARELQFYVSDINIWRD